MLSSGVKDTDHVAKSCQIAAPLGDYSRPFAKVRRQLRESFVLVQLSHLSLSSISYYPCFSSFFLCFFPLFSCFLYRHISHTSLKHRLLFETICQLCKTQSWRWFPEVEVTSFIQQFIHGTCQGWLLQIRHRVRQIRITKTETCLLKWSFSICVFFKRVRRGLDWQLIDSL